MPKFNAIPKNPKRRDTESTNTPFAYSYCNQEYNISLTEAVEHVKKCKKEKAAAAAEQQLQEEARRHGAQERARGRRGQQQQQQQAPAM